MLMIEKQCLRCRRRKVKNCEQMYCGGAEKEGESTNAVKLIARSLPAAVLHCQWNRIEFCIYLYWYLQILFVFQHICICFLQLERSRRLQRVHVCTFPVNEPLLPCIYLLTNNYFYFIFLLFWISAVFLSFDQQFFQSQDLFQKNHQLIAVTYCSFDQQFELSNFEL